MARSPLAARSIPASGASTFAERPDVAAPAARLIWHAERDPATLSVVARPASNADPDSVAFARFGPWLTIATDRAGREHAVLSDGIHHIRIDVEHGHLVADGPVVLHYRLEGIASVEPRLIALRRLVGLVRTGRFAASLFPADRRMERALLVLRVHDALTDGASQRDIAAVLFGAERVAADAARGSESLRSRVRRLVREARRMARGGYRSLLQRR